MKNPGIIYRITSGQMLGKYALALNADQQEHYLKQKRFFVHLFHDEDLTRRVIEEKSGKKLCSIMHQDHLKYHGMQD